ncbi:hypothetical protein Scep_006437 [Stephania cephalantha]|uniref:Phospholipase D n=1 Tax=Stephania cephalantha TaxID=152367 RepID=A0AAP0K973_9MAGN
MKFFEGSSSKLFKSFHSSSSSSSSQGTNLENSQSLKVLLLHGNLSICVHEAKNLPNMDLMHEKLNQKLERVLPTKLSTKIEGHLTSKITSDPYVSIVVSSAVIARTFVIENSENPVWEQHFSAPVAHFASQVKFLVKDNDVVGSQVIGYVGIPVVDLVTGDKVVGVFPVLGVNGEPLKGGASLRISIQYIPIENQSDCNSGSSSVSDRKGFLGTYFPIRRSGKVRLYQDAHVHDESLPVVKLDGGVEFEHGKCWEDICKAIKQARHLVYVTGWSVYHKVRLVRDGGALDCTLGDLLKLKSQEGVRVLLLLWDDPTSQDIFGHRVDGQMNTNDEETKQFFKHSLVQVLLCPRSFGKQHSWAKQQEAAIYTHHQKTVIVDADAGNNKRKIIAFLGGLDLCRGRYDTPTHSLFRTLQTVHKDDFYNPNFKGPIDKCPREPWHDLHCQIDGPAAYDVLTNFEERWLKASTSQGGLEKLINMRRSHDDSLLKLERIPNIIGRMNSHSLGEGDPENWHVQIFRSIDSNSVEGFPDDPKDIMNKSLVCGKNVLIDMSIHAAYVKAIRDAQHFIYIENQYFLGSSYNWNSHKDLGANNLIPMEIALKIVNKIKSNERFSVYIVIPMWPEGAPTGPFMQRILYWQHKTMEMMYEMVYNALEEVGLENTYTPEDYLNFFCLGNREALDEHDIENSPLDNSTPQELTQRSRRFMIYVHSKGMIVDDEYVILGSANINQRSMEGTRDTEIAMGAYQPLHLWRRKQSLPRGQVHGYRMSLWAEHTGTLEDSFTRPESLECVRRVRELGELNWKQFISDEITDMRGHLLKYPVEVGPKGELKPLESCKTFPDLGGRIQGSFLGIQENLTI